MNPWVGGIIGFVLGWIIELVIDCFWWQKRRILNPENSDNRPSIDETQQKINELESTIRELRGRVSIIPGLQDTIANKSKQHNQLLIEVEQLRATLGNTNATHSGNLKSLNEDNKKQDKQERDAIFVDNHVSQEVTSESQPTGKSSNPENGKKDSPRAKKGKGTPDLEQKTDNLCLIRGIGPKTVEVLSQLNIHSFYQIATFTAADIKRVNEHMRFKGRIEKERWIEQAKELSLDNVKNSNRKQ